MAPTEPGLVIIVLFKLSGIGLHLFSCSGRHTLSERHLLHRYILGATGVRSQLIDVED